MEPLAKFRPVRVSLLALLVLFYTLFNGLRLGEAIYFWKTLLEYGAHPWYVAASGGVWLIAGSFLLWGLWGGRSWAWLATFLGTIAYLAWYWLDRFFLQMPHSNVLFSILASAVLSGLVLLVLLSRRTRWYFLREAHER